MAGAIANVPVPTLVFGGDVNVKQLAVEPVQTVGPAITELVQQFFKVTVVVPIAPAPLQKEKSCCAAGST